MWLPAECIPALSMLSIHSPDYVFTVLVSIFMKTHNHFLSSMQCYKYVYTAIYSKSDGVLHFHYSHMHVRTPPALCLGTECWTRPKNPQNSRGFIGEVQQCETIWHRYAWEHQWCTIQKTKTFTMNANLAQKSSRLKGMLSVKFSNMSGPKILKIQRSSIGDVLRAMWGVNLAQICFGAPWVHYPCTKKVQVLAPMDSKGCLAMWDSGPEILKK